MSTDPLAEALSQVASQVAVEILVPDVTNAITPVISTELRDLDKVLTDEAIEQLVVEYGGLADPIGQLQKWLADRLSEFADYIVSAFQTIIAPIQDAVNRVYSFLTSLSYTITSSFSSLAQSLSSWFSQLLSAVESLKETVQKVVIEPITTFVANIAGYIKQVIESAQQFITMYVIEPLTSFVTNIYTMLSQVPSIVQSAIQSLLTGVESAVTTIRAFIEQNILAPLQDFITRYIVEPLTSLVAQISSAIAQIPSMIQTITVSLQSLLTTARDTIARYVIEPLMTLADQIVSAITQLPSMIQNALDTLTSGIRTAISEASRLVHDYVIAPLTSMISALGTTISQTLAVAREAINTLTATIPRILAELRDHITRYVVEPLSGVVAIVSQIPSVVQSFISSLHDFLTKLPSYAVKIISDIEAFVWEHLPDWAKEFLVKGASALYQLGVAVQGFVNAILKFPEWFPEWFKNYIAEPIVDAIESLAKPLQPLATALGTFASVIEKLIANPMDVVRTVASAITGAMSWIAQLVLSAISTLAGWLSQIANQMANITVTVFNAVHSTLAKVTETASNILSSIVRGAVNLYTQPLVSSLKKLIPAMVAGGAGEVETLIGIISAIVPSYIMATLTPKLLKALAKNFKGVRIRLGIPGTNIQIHLSPAEILYELGDKIERLPERIAEHSILGWTLVALEPLRYVFRAGWKNFMRVIGQGNVPFALPPLGGMIELARRYGIEDSIPIIREILSYRGLPDWFIDKFTKIWKEASKIIKDRFGNLRHIPLSPVYVQPSVSDVCRFMIRDMFYGPEALEHFKTWTSILGLYSDVAFFYYLLHFRYPSPERLWEFVSRGIAGLLWYTPSKSEVDLATAEAKSIGAFAPTAPSQLNFNAEALFNALFTYMKWHDYARFSWIENFTSDNWLVIDTLADIPTKIDQRWMVKWGIYELMSAKGVKLETPISEIRSKIIEDRAKTKEITLDLRIFSRTLQATGIHPDWVPIVAVAESINALTEERTLLRTGFINLYKEGFFTVSDLEQLLAGFFTASFQVAYFDMADRKWKEGWINIPVMFLPAERKLLELRAIFDRAVDLLRDLMRALHTGVRELITSPSDAVSKLKSYIETMNNEWFKNEVKAVSGAERALVVDEKWATLYMKYGEILQDIYTIHRARYYSRYLFWRLIYRFERGFITRKEVEQIASDLVTKIRESPLVKDLIIYIADIMNDAFLRELKAKAIINRVSRGLLKYEEGVKELTKLGLPEELARAYIDVHVRGYIPTVPQLATLVEVVPEAIALKSEVYEIRGVPEHHRRYWDKYLEVRPLLDELRMLRTWLITAYAEEVLTAEEFTKHLEKLKEFGWTDRELNIIKQIADIRRLIYIARSERKENVPTPTQIATMMEWIKIPENIILDAMRKRRIPETWRKYWLEYIKIAPLRDEIRMLRTRLRDAMVYGVDISLIFKPEVQKKVDEVWSAVGKELEALGITKDELLVLYRVGYLDYLVDQAKLMLREYIPTPTMLATMSEYVVIPDNLVREALELRRIPERWRSIWLKYITVRPLADEGRRLANAYFRAKRYEVELGDLEKQVLDILKQIGYTDTELKIRELTALIEHLIDQAREYIPTPMMLATLSEYIALPRDMVLEALRKRRVPERWLKFWLNYIEVRPLANDINALAYDYLRALEYAVIGQDIEKQILNILKYGGWIDREIDILKLRAGLRRTIRLWREYTPTLARTLAMAMYVEDYRGFINQIFDARGYPKEDRNIYIHNVRARRLWRWIRSYVFELINDYAYGVINETQLRSELNALKPFGLDDEQISLIVRLAKLRRNRYARRYGGG